MHFYEVAAIAAIFIELVLNEFSPTHCLRPEEGYQVLCPCLV
jgi:hypothetical protein